MLSEVRFGSVLCYSPKGVTDVSRTSRTVRDKVKNGDAATLRRFVEVLGQESAEGKVLHHFFTKDTLLVPMPRSAPLVAGALWPAKKICDAMAASGFGMTVPCLDRTVSVPKSAFAKPGERPNVPTHFASLAVNQPSLQGQDIVVIDDIITKGSSVIAAASRLAETFPKARIRTFAVIRTRGLQAEIDQIIEPAVGSVTLLLDSGQRDP